MIHKISKNAYTDATEEEEGEDIKRVVVAAAFAIILAAAYPDDPVPENTSILTGDLYFRETMDNPNENNFLHVTRMDKLTFERLLRLLTSSGQLRDGRVLTAGEKIFNFLHVLKGNSHSSQISAF